MRKIKFGASDKGIVNLEKGVVVQRKILNSSSLTSSNTEYTGQPNEQSSPITYDV